MTKPITEPMTEQTLHEDYALIEDATRKAKAGDKNAQATLLMLYKPLLCKIASKAAQFDPDDAEDCLQDMSLELLNAITAYDPAKGNFTMFLKSWLTKAYYKRGRSPSLQADLSLDAPVEGEEDNLSLHDILPEPGSDPAERYIAHDTKQHMRRKLKRWIGTLTPKQKEVIIRHDIQGESLRAIADERRHNIRAVTVLRQRALNKYNTHGKT